MEIKPMLELTRVDFGNVSSKIMKVKCEDNEKMGEIKLEALTDLLEIKTILDEKIKNGATNVDRLKDRINKLNDRTTSNITRLKDENKTLSDSNFAKKNRKLLQRARKASQSIDNRLQKALRKKQKQ